ncbi:hypothetical protein BG004_003876 [Podila humilis]|nr:hypothetical protein BG004_003876 [Podila humilis]
MHLFFLASSPLLLLPLPARPLLTLPPPPPPPPPTHPPRSLTHGNSKQLTQLQKNDKLYHRPGPMELGEILTLIAPWLQCSSHDLASCALVSTHWYSIFNPQLWRTVVISESRHRPEHLPYLAKHIQSVQTLQWEYTEWWMIHHVTRTQHPQKYQEPHRQHHHQKLSPKPNVAHAYPGKPTYRPPTPISFPTTTTLHGLQLDQAIRLETLVLDGPFELIPLLHTLACTNASQVRVLSLKNTNCIRRETLCFAMFLRVSPLLERLAIRTHAIIVEETAQAETTRNAHQSSSVVEEMATEEEGGAVRILELDVRSMTGAILEAIIAQCPCLEKISWTEYGTPMLATVGPAAAAAAVAAARKPETDAVKSSCSCVAMGLSPKTTEAVTIRTGIRQRDVGQEGRGVQPQHHCHHHHNHCRHHHHRFPQTRNINVDPVTLSSLTPPSPLPYAPFLLPAHSVFGAIGLRALAQFSLQTLTSLDIGQAGAGKIHSKSLQMFLQQCPSLVHLKVRGGSLQVLDMVSRNPESKATLVSATNTIVKPLAVGPADGIRLKLVPWACNNLQTLSVSFSTSDLFSTLFANVPRSNSSCSDDDSITNGGITIYDMQSWAESIVFAQLSLLTSLQTLEIKNSFMRLTLGTGFERMKSLSTLKEFSMAGPNINGLRFDDVPMQTLMLTNPIIKKESLYNESMADWFDQHWPHLKSIQVASRDSRTSAVDDIPKSTKPTKGPMPTSRSSNSPTIPSTKTVF